jgi:hypothetical protein
MNRIKQLIQQLRQTHDWREQKQIKEEIDRIKNEVPKDRGEPFFWEQDGEKYYQ